MKTSSVTDFENGWSNCMKFICDTKGVTCICINSKLQLSFTQGDKMKTKTKQSNKRHYQIHHG